MSLVDDAGLTPARLTAALRAGGRLGDDVAVTAVDAAQVGTGQMASCVRLDLTFDGATVSKSSIHTFR